jgi:hypothetical protein
MQKVVDSNYLQIPELEAFLKSKHNKAVFTDFVCMEAYQGEDLRSVFASFAIASRYPKQLVALKTSEFSFPQAFKASELPNALIDGPTTENMKSFFAAFKSAENGQPLYRWHLDRMGERARKFLEDRKQDAAQAAQAWRESTAGFTKDELRLVRDRKPYTADMVHRVFDAAFEQGHLMAEAHPDLIRELPPREWPNTLWFRAKLCEYLLALYWRGQGDTPKDPAKIRNDLLDVHQAAYATYFDGLLTKDERLSTIYWRATQVLDMQDEILGARVFTA